MVLSLAGCARAAPDLPPVFGSAPPSQMESAARLQRCTALKTEIANLRGEIKTAEDVIAGKRHQDQVEGYFAAVLFPPAMLMIDQQKAQKRALDDRQKEIDLKLGEQHTLQCP
jgi:hypothetical protein